jgi:transcriptional regulator with XRE-family HTH domain
MGTDEAAAACGVKQSAYSKWENNRTRPDDDQLEGIAAFLGVTRREVVLARSAELIGDEPDELGQLRSEVAELKELVKRLPSSADKP